MLRGRQHHQGLYPCLSTVGCMGVLPPLPEPLWVHTLSYPSRPAHPPCPPLKRMKIKTTTRADHTLETLEGKMNWANGGCTKSVHLNLSFDKKIKWDGSDHTVSSRVPPVPPTRDHTLVFMQRGCPKSLPTNRLWETLPEMTQTRVDTSFASQALSAHPVISALRDAEQAETRPRWRHAAESAVWPQTPWVWRPPVRFQCTGTASTGPEAAARVIVFDPFVNKSHHGSVVRAFLRGLDFAKAARTSDAQTGGTRRET